MPGGALCWLELTTVRAGGAGLAALLWRGGVVTGPLVLLADVLFPPPGARVVCLM